MKNFLSALWQLPQNLLGAIIIILFHGVRLDEYDTKTTNLLSVNSVRYGNVYIIKIRRKYDTAQTPRLGKPRAVCNHRGIVSAQPYAVA